jgi:uncharacterized membrane protein
VTAETANRARTAAALRIATLGVMALIASLLIAWQWQAATPRLWLQVLSLVPLLTPLPGLIRQERRTFAWASLLTIPYMALAVTEVIADPTHRAIPAALLLLAFAWLIILVAYLRVTR